MSFLNRFLPSPPHDDVLASVVRNLTHLLNSRREYGSLLCSFGIVGYLAESDGQQAALSILREIQETVVLYEPRLRVLNLKSLGRDADLWLCIELEGLLLLQDVAVECALYIRFNPSFGAAEILPPARPALLPKAPARALPPVELVPKSVLSAATLAAQLGAEAVLDEQPGLAPILVVAALAAEAGLLPDELADSALEAGIEALSSRFELALGLALAGQAAQAGLLSPSLARAAAQAAKLALESNGEVAELVAEAGIAARAQGAPSAPERTDPKTAEVGLSPLGGARVVGRPAIHPAAVVMTLCAGLAADRGLLSVSVADAVRQSPKLALRNTVELSGAVAVASLAAQFGSPLPRAQPRRLEDSDGS